MKEFISNDEFNQVLEILGLPGKTLEFTVGGRTDYEPMSGVKSSWRMRATIGDMIKRGEDLYPYQVRVVYVPVMLPNDQEENDRVKREMQDRRSENGR